MSAALTVDSLESILGRTVQEIHLTVAKSSVLGLDPETIAHTLGVNKGEIDALMESQDYKDIRLLVGAEQAKERVERDFGWDGIESQALKTLGKRVKLENDTDTLLRIAAVANRATRRTAPPKESPLDPANAGARVPLTLTKRFTEKLNGSGQVVERQVSHHISVLDGSAINPNFEEVKGLLTGNVTPTPQAPRTRQAYIEKVESADEEDFSLEALRKMAKGIRGG
jgi:hypothetical protein